QALIRLRAAEVRQPAGATRHSPARPPSFSSRTSPVRPIRSRQRAPESARENGTGTAPFSARAPPAGQAAPAIFSIAARSESPVAGANAARPVSIPWPAPHPTVLHLRPVPRAAHRSRMPPLLPPGSALQTQFFPLCGRASLLAEFFAANDFCAVHEFEIGNAVAAFELDVLGAKHRRAAADHQQSVLLRRGDDYGQAARSHRLQRLAPDLARLAAKFCEGSGPGLQPADAVVYFRRGEK